MIESVGTMWFLGDIVDRVMMTADVALGLSRQWVATLTFAVGGINTYYRGGGGFVRGVSSRWHGVGRVLGFLAF